VIVATTIAEVRGLTGEARRAGRTVGMVPTMGYFHLGHRSLMTAAVADCDLVVVSSFVNPTQFGPNEDLAAYPSDAEGDDAMAVDAGVHVMFRPDVAEMYPGGPPRTTVHVAELTDDMCGAARPTHFDGVTTVVAKLFSIVGPCRAYFGRKDFQQLAVVRRMVLDLDLPVEVVGCPTVREPDGLAMSSRNAYLTAEERAVAPLLHAALVAGADAVAAGMREPARVRDVVTERVAAEPRFALEYVEVRDATSLEPLATLDDSFVVALAARLGRARLIDNVVVTVGPDGVDVDPGVRSAPDGPVAGSTP
jgi:pantoate--beta-alanine ligase